MSWIQKLYDTCEQCSSKDFRYGDGDRMMPIDHTLQQAHIHVEIDSRGNFLRANPLNKELIVLPATEKSAGRTSGEAPHPLMDKVQYCGKDYGEFGGLKKCYFDSYEKQLREWCQSLHSHPKAEAVCLYIQKGMLVSDLVTSGVLFVDESGNLLTGWADEEKEPPPIFKMLTKKKEGGKSVQDQGDALVCWSVNVPGEPDAATWGDQSLQDAWVGYCGSMSQEKGLCYVTGKERPVAGQHPSKLRHSGDKAKLISSNDIQGFTFRGRFTDNGSQACGVGTIVTQKAHSALRWLVSRQGYRNGDQVFLSWAVSGKPIPQTLIATDDLWAGEIPDKGEVPVANGESSIDHTRDAGQRFALKLRSFMRGYSKTISPTEEIVVMGLDSATPGRMGIIYYRELLGSEFIARLESWHQSAVWWQRFTKQIGDGSKKKGKTEVDWRLSSPAPKVIAETAFGSRLDDKLKKATVERLVPCIIDGRQIPWDLVASCVRRVSNRVGMDHWAWEKSLGVTCALYRGFYIRHTDPEKRREYTMALDVECTNRDYLYGRLLAIAEHVEDIALHAGGESRPTTAARLMQRFSDRPYSTWMTIEKALQPYMQRLHNSRSGFLVNMNKLFDEVHVLFNHGEYTSENRLSGEYLLGYHCQRRELKKKIDKDQPSETKGE